jgi:drug/metabolite transporter (DMT)-like permease
LTGQVILGLASALVAATLYGIAAILQAAGSRRAAGPGTGLDAGLVGRLLRQPAYVGALVLTLLGFVFHLIAVRLLPLFLAQVGIAVSLVVTALLAVRVFGDRLDHGEWAAVGGVVAGLTLLSAAAGETGRERSHGWLAVALFVTLAVVVAAGLLTVRHTSTAATAVLGFLGGIGYAVLGIAARLLPDSGPGELATSPATYALVVGGPLAFLLYSLALQRGAVTAATTPLISAQTLIPAIVGITFLGDKVRTGWWPAVIIGFLVTAVSAVTLVRFEQVDPTLSSRE